MPWKEKAKDLFFESGMGTGEIAEYLGVSRQSVSGYLKRLPGYDAERDRRKAASRENRREYKRKKNKEYRDAANTVTADTMKREHDIAVMILSHEKY